MTRRSPARFATGPYADPGAYLRADASWPATDTAVNNKAAGLARLILGSSEYQFV